MTTSGSAISTLFIAIISGIPAPPISEITSLTARICSEGSGWEPSTTWTMRSAPETSSRVDLKASIS